MSQRTTYLKKADRLKLKISKEDSPKRKARLEENLKHVTQCIKNIEHYGSPKKPDGIPIGVNIGVPRG